MSSDTPASLDQVIEVMRAYLDTRQTDRLNVQQRLDFLVQELGSLRELGHAIDVLSGRVERVEIIQQTSLEILKEAQREFDTRTAIVLKDAEALRLKVSDASTAFQLAQEHQDKDWDEKWQSLQRDIARLEQRMHDRSGEVTALTIARIGSRERLQIALLVFLASVLTTLITSLVTGHGL